MLRFTPPIPRLQKATWNPIYYPQTLLHPNPYTNQKSPQNSSPSTALSHEDLDSLQQALNAQILNPNTQNPGVGIVGNNIPF